MWRLSTVFLAASPLLSATPEQGWLQLKPGLSPTETSQLLGAPMLASRGGDFERANYDRCGELLFVRGQLVAWSAPAKFQTAPVPAGTWTFAQHPVPSSRAKSTATRLPTPDRRNPVMPSYRW
jgi:hypothetical protein